MILLPSADPAFSPASRGALARALDGDACALRELVHAPVSETRLLPALALEAKRQGIAPPYAWRAALHRTTVTWMTHEATLERLALDLTRLGIPWLPIKGWDVAERFYEAREARPMSDVDLLVPRPTFDRMRRGLEARGWEPVYRGEQSDRYLREEGYCWPIVHPDCGLAELHLRLWGLVPKGLETTLLERSRPHASGGFRIGAAHAWLLSAVHCWLMPSPQGLLPFWDLERIARTQSPQLSPESLAALARAWDLQLPTMLSAETASALWGHPTHRGLSRILRRELRLPERRIARRLLGDEVDAIDLSDIVLARLLSGRRSRAGWRSLLRRLWAHPGVVERETPDDLSYWQRRLQHLLKGLGIQAPFAREETP